MTNKEYDVFLNHRGPDTKDQFLVPLVEKLKEAGIRRSFMDRQNVHHGENVFEVVEAALESARMYIAFFSKNYAQSTYCLKELHQMLLTGRPIITVFYDVLPEHVRRPRNKNGPYAEAFIKHEARQTPQDVRSWEAALEKAADLRGFVRANYRDDDEWLAKSIVEEVVRLLRNVTIPPRGGQYDWSSHYELPARGQGIIYFTAETHRNLHVTFSPKAGIVYPSYEIVIGYQLSSGQTRSEIRRLEPESTVCSSYPLNLDVPLQEDGEYHFWICIDEETQFIYVGRGEHPHEENAFIIFKDPSFLQGVQYFAFSSGQVAITYKNIKVERRPPSLLGQESSTRMWSSIETPRQDLSLSPGITFSRPVGEYNWSMAYQLPTEGRGIVCFSVRAITNIVHVAISPEPQTMDPMYEVVIGGWGKSECNIRRGDILCRVRTFDAIVEVGKPNQFWMSINTDTQLIHVGTGNQPNLASILLVYKDPCFITDARYVSFLSTDTEDAYSEVVVGSPSTTTLLVPRSVKLSPLLGKYEWNPSYKFSSEGQGILFFSVEARNDVMLAISSKCETVDPMYEIVIGGWGNTRSGLRRCAQGELVCSVDYGLTNTEGLNDIWVSIDKETQLIQIGEQSDLKSAFLMFKDPSFLSDAVYFAFSSWNTPVTYSAVSVSFERATITKPIQYATPRVLFQSATMTKLTPSRTATFHKPVVLRPSADFLQLSDIGCPSELHESTTDTEGEMLDLHLSCTAKCMEGVQKLPSPKFNTKLCEYLRNKLRLVVGSAGLFLEVSRIEHNGPGLSVNAAMLIATFKLMLVRAKEIEIFILGCSKDAWIQAAMTMTNVSEYVASIGFNLELCRVVFCQECGAAGCGGPLTLEQVKAINDEEVRIVKAMALVDGDALFWKVVCDLPQMLPGTDEKDLATYLLQRLIKVEAVSSSVVSSRSSWYSDISDSFSSLFNRPEQIGRGVSAVVYKGMWLGEPVAKKTFEGRDNPEFLKEVEILAKLSHPNITSMFCCQKNKRSCSILMELMDGNLHDLLEECGESESESPPFTILEKVDLMLEIGEGVTYLHENGVIHRDLKSRNILVKTVLAEQSDVEIRFVRSKVTDFAISKTKCRSNTYSSQTVNTGTDRWMAPEVIDLGGDREVSPSSEPNRPKKIDVYSFGILCYEILTGDIPFSHETSSRIMKQKILEGDRPDLLGDCPLMLKALIKECWDQTPEKRPSFPVICSKLKYVKYLLMAGLSGNEE